MLILYMDFTTTNSATTLVTVAMRLPIFERALRSQRCDTLRNEQYVAFPVFFQASGRSSIILFLQLSLTAAIIKK